MTDGSSALTEEDVQRLARLIESLESSNFDYMQLQIGDLKVTIGKGAVPVAVPAVGAPVGAASGMRAVTTPGTPGIAAPDVAAAGAAPAVGAPVGAATAVGAPAPPAGTIEIKSHIMGMFYSRPEPGAPPFVSLGAEVNEATTVCLIEVMKTFNAMTAGVKGVITEICVQNSQLVEYGQVLFRVQPSFS